MLNEYLIVCLMQVGCGGFLSMCSLLVFFLTNLQRCSSLCLTQQHWLMAAYTLSLIVRSYWIKLQSASAAFSFCLLVWRIILFSGWPVPSSWSEAQSLQHSHQAALNCKDTPTKQMWKWRKGQTGSRVWRWKSECWCWMLSVPMLHRSEVSGKRKGNSGRRWIKWRRVSWRVGKTGVWSRLQWIKQRWWGGAG